MKFIVDEMPIKESDCDYARSEYHPIEDLHVCTFQQPWLHDCPGTKDCPHFIGIKDALNKQNREG